MSFFLIHVPPCLAAALSEEPTADTITTESPQPNSQEALEELSKLDNDFSRDWCRQPWGFPRQPAPLPHKTRTPGQGAGFCG